MDDADFESKLEDDLEQPRRFPLKGVELRKMLLGEMEKLPSRDRIIFENAAHMMGIGAMVSGLGSNAVLRSLLKVRQAAIASAFPSAFIPYITVTMFHETFLSQSLLGGHLNCDLCAVTRGALIGALGCGAHPITMALLLNGMLIATHRPWDAPTLAEGLRHMLKLSKPGVQMLGPVLLVQAGLGAFLGSKQFSIYTKLRSLTAREKLLE